MLVTEDKDFGELVYLRRLQYPCVVRLVELRVTEKVDALRDLLERHGSTLRAGAMVVITRKRVRIRSAGFVGRDDG